MHLAGLTPIYLRPATTRQRGPVENAFLILNPSDFPEWDIWGATPTRSASRAFSVNLTASALPRHPLPRFRLARVPARCAARKPSLFAVFQRRSQVNCLQYAVRG